MNINLYTNNSPKIKKDKDITLVRELTGSLREKCDIIDPSILITSSTPITANYAYIPDFGRYYFIKKITTERADLWRLDMHVDVYMSFKDEIVENTPIFERSEYLFNLYLPDNLLPVTQDTFTVTQKLGTDELTHANIILTVQS